MPLSPVNQSGRNMPAPPADNSVPRHKAEGRSFPDAVKAKLSGLKRPQLFQESEETRKKKEVAEQFKQVKGDEVKTDALMASLIAKARHASPEAIKKLIPNNKVLQEVLSEILNDIVPPGKELLHAAVHAHLAGVLEPRKSGVPGISLTGFSHIRLFETVMPHEYTPTSGKDAYMKIVADSLEQSKKPKIPTPGHVFTLEQLQQKRDPDRNLNIPLPRLDSAIYGQDLAGNHVVGLHGKHAALSDIFEQMRKSHLDPIAIGSSAAPYAWAEAAWIAALMQVPPDTLADKLAKDLETDEDSQKLIPQMRHAAVRLQALMADEARRTSRAEVTKEVDDVLNECRTAFTHLTRALLAQKGTLQKEYLLNNPSIPDQVHITSLMSALGAKCIITKYDLDEENGKPLPNLTFHSEAMKQANEVFGEENPEAQKSFFSEAINGVPIVRITPTGFELNTPMAFADTSEQNGPDATPDGDTPPGQEHAQTTSAPPAQADKPEPPTKTAPGVPPAPASASAGGAGEDDPEMSHEKPSS